MRPSSPPNGFACRPETISTDGFRLGPSELKKGVLVAEMLSEFAIVILAISLASERFVVFMKTLVTRLQSPEQQATNLVRAPAARGRRVLTDKERRIWVMLASLFAAWVTAAFLAEGVTNVGSYFAQFLTGHVEIANRNWPNVVVAFLASGGSAFWAQVVGYASALKDIKQTQTSQDGTALSGGRRDLADLSWAELKRATNLGQADGGS